MSLVPGISNPYLAAFAGGLFYGLVFCTSACLPYVASYVAGVGAGFRRGVIVTLTYNTGRIAAYAMIGGVIGLLNGSFRFFVDQSSLLPLQQYSSIAFGIVTIIIGAGIIVKSRNVSCNPAEQQDIKQHVIKRGRFDFGAFSLGLSRGLIVCPALLVLLLYSLTFGAPIDSLALAVLFGLGTALSSLLLLGGATGWLLNKAPLFRTWISRLGAVALMLMGIGTMVTTMVNSG